MLDHHAADQRHRAQVIEDGEDNVLAGMRPGTVVIEMSSGVPTVTQQLAERVASLGGHLIDAPVSGGVPRARTGQLAIMAGGDAAVIDRVLPVLQAMGPTVLRTGAVGSGQAMKALNNLVSTGGFLIGIEALLIGQRFGLDPAVMVDVLNAATGMNNSTQKKFKQFVLSRRFDAGFTMGLLHKDVSIALELGRETATPAPVSALCKELIASAVAMFGSEPIIRRWRGCWSGWRARSWGAGTSGMAESVPKRMTVEEFIPWAMARPETEHYELVAGEMVAMAPERSVHARTKFRIAGRLAEAIEKAGLACEAFIDGWRFRWMRTRSMSLMRLCAVGTGCPTMRSS